MTRAAGEQGPGTADTAPRGTMAVLGQYLARKGAPIPEVPARAVAPRPTPERAMVIAVGRAAQSACAMPIYPTQARSSPAILAELSELLPERSLILVVEAPQGVLGVVALCPALLAAVIEMQSLGRVTRQPPRERRPTRTDASICADFVNALLAELSAELAAIGRAVPHYRFASFVEDAKPLELILDDIGYRSLRIDMRVGQGGVRDASLLVFLPDPAGESAALAPPAGPASAKPVPPAVPRSLAEAVRLAPVALNAVLCRRQISLRELRQLRPGSILKLPHEAMTSTRLETAHGQVLAQGKLGALHGSRAIRIAGTSGGAAAGADSPAAGMASAAAQGDHSADAAARRDNVFAATAEEEDAQDLSLLAESPLGDGDLPDPFRPDPAPEDAAESGAAMAVPLNFVIE